MDVTKTEFPLDIVFLVPLVISLFIYDFISDLVTVPSACLKYISSPTSILPTVPEVTSLYIAPSLFTSFTVLS